MINIKINGLKHSVAEDSLYNILNKLNYIQKWSAIELNGEILQQTQLKQTNVQQGDSIEVITPVGGG